MANPRNIVCLVIDRLHSGFVGAYGNTWIATPHIDHFASESFLFDRAMIDSPRLDYLYRAYWQGRHALAGPSIVAAASLETSLPRQLRAAGFSSVLLTDEPAIAQLPLANDFDERDELNRTASDEVANSIEETQLARFFAAAVERLAAMQPPFCLWLHTGSLGWTWDAPFEFRNQYADEDDPPPPESATVPSRTLARDYDPDELLGIVHSYAGQVSLLDLCVGSFVEATAESSRADDTLLVLLSARGMSLGEHGRVGPGHDSLYSEVTQIPWLLRFPDRAGQSARTQALVQPADLYSTLAEWCDLTPPNRSSDGAGHSLLPLVHGVSEMVRDRACAIHTPIERAIATPAWYLLEAGDAQNAVTPLETGPPPESESPTKETVRQELYVKPDDRFEVNEVADRCPDCVSQLHEAFAQFQQSCQTGDSSLLPALPDVLVSGME